MNVVYLTTSGSSVRRRGEILQVWRRREKIAEVRLFELERLVLVGSIEITSPALGLLLDRGVDVVFLTARGRLRGTLVAGLSRNVFLRLAQFERFRDASFRLRLSRRVAAAKLRAQKRILRRYRRNHPQALEASAEERLADCLGRLEEAPTIDEVRGLEGTGAAACYGEFGRMLRGIGFPGRKKHPSTDPVNALLSLGYVLLTREVGAALEAQGFDPAIGFLHGLRYGRQSLALDLVEPFRQPVIDRLTLRLFNRGQFSADDFEGGERGLRLSPEALKQYFGCYEEQLRSASGRRGTAGTADTADWRQRIRDRVTALREMVMSGEAGPLDAWGR